MVPKLWLDLLGKGGLSSEGLGEPGLGVAEKREGREEVDREGRKEAAGRGLGPDTYHGHMALLPPGCWGRSRARRQEVDTAKELRGGREETGAQARGGEREKTRSEMAQGLRVTVGRRAQGPTLALLPPPPALTWAPRRPSYLEKQYQLQQDSEAAASSAKPGDVLTPHRPPRQTPGGVRS